MTHGHFQLSKSSQFVMCPDPQDGRVHVSYMSTRTNRESDRYISMSEEQIVVKRGPGRPRKIVAAATEREPLREPAKLKMRAKPNWETMDPADDTENPDRLRIE